MKAANRSLSAAAKLSVRFAFPFRRNTRRALEWAVSANSSWKFRYLLAVQRAAQCAPDAEVDSLLASCDNADDAVLFHYRALRHKGAERRADLLRARKLDDSWRIGRDLVQTHLDEKNWAEAESVAGDYLSRYGVNVPLQMLYVKSLCGLKRFEDAVKYLEEMNVLPAEGSGDAHGLWQEAWEGIARQALAAGDKGKADAALMRRAEYPENLGRGKPYPEDK